MNSARMGFKSPREAAGKSAAPDFASLSRKELLKLLRGKNAGNIFVMKTEELRAIAVKASDQSKI